MGSAAAFVLPRPMCVRCRRPTRVCYCRALPRLPTTTRVVILQHPRERDMPIGTARMASLCLPGAELHVGVRWDDSAPLARALADPARPPILLYPGPGARDILREPPRGPVTLVVVDGTWSQARTLVRDNPVLQALPRYAFATPEPSHYRIRREPRAEYVSTIEALMHVLGVLEGDPPRFRSLLDPLRAMVDAQIACQAQSPRSGPSEAGNNAAMDARKRVTVPRQPRQPRAARPRVPEVIARRFEDLVCVVGEANAWPYRGSASRHPDELVHWVAHRIATGETFDRIVAPTGPLSPSTAFHCALTEEALRAGAPCAEVRAAFARFTRAGDILCAWGHYGLNLVERSGGARPAERLDLRAAAFRIANRKLGSLEAYAANLAAPTPDPPAQALAPLAAGRAGKRLAMVVQIVRAWRSLSSE